MKPSRFGLDPASVARGVVEGLRIGSREILIANAAQSAPRGSGLKIQSFRRSGCRS
jgi:hypothetical protein